MFIMMFRKHVQILIKFGVSENLPQWRLQGGGLGFVEKLFFFLLENNKGLKIWDINCYKRISTILKDKFRKEIMSKSKFWHGNRTISTIAIRIWCHICQLIVFLTNQEVPKLCTRNFLNFKIATLRIFGILKVC